MTTWRIDIAYPAAGGNSVGYSTPTPSGLSLDDTVTGTGTTKSILDNITASTATLKVQKFLHTLQMGEKSGKKWMATSDSGTTYIKPAQ